MYLVYNLEKLSQTKAHVITHTSLSMRARAHTHTHVHSAETNGSAGREMLTLLLPHKCSSTWPNRGGAGAEVTESDREREGGRRGTEGDGGGGGRDEGRQSLFVRENECKKQHLLWQWH